MGTRVGTLWERAQCADVQLLNFHEELARPERFELPTPCGQKIKTAGKTGVIPSRRSLAACRPLGFLGRLRAPSRIGGHARVTYGVGTYPGLHHWDGGPGAVSYTH